MTSDGKHLEGLVSFVEETLNECLVEEKQHGLDFRPYKNIYEEGAEQPGQPDSGEQRCANRG